MFLTKRLLFILFLLSSAVFSQSQDSVENWKQYNAPMAGFNIKYPADWTLYKEEASGKVWRVMFMSPSVKDKGARYSSSITICSKPRAGSFNDWGGCRQKDDHLSDLYKDTVIAEKTFGLNGLKIRKKATEGYYRPTASYFYAFFSTKDRDFLVSSNFPRKFGLDDQIPVFDRMLSTFQSVKEDPVTIYRNDEYDFALSYPQTWKNCPTGEIN